MASVSSAGSSSSLVSSLSGKGIGGLATGLDTDSLVAALTAGTQSKIAKQGQQKQLLNWKMTAYRSMTTALSAFQAKSLKIGTTGTNTNITSNSFFNTYKATSSSSAVSVSTTSSSTTGNFTISEVKKLAEAEKFTSVNKLSATLGMNINDGNPLESGAFTGQTLKLDVEGFTTKTIKLDSLNAYINEDDGSLKMDGDDNFVTAFQDLIDSAYSKKSDGKHVVDVKLSGGQIILDSSSAKVSVNTKNDLLGFKQGDTNRVNTSMTLESLDAFKDIQGNTMSFMINGVEITVNKTDTISSLMSKVTNSSANVRMEYDKFSDQFTLTSKTTGADSKIEMRDVHGNFLSEIFGAQGGNGVGTGILTMGDSIMSFDANTIDGMSTADKKALASTLKNMSFELTVNGVTKTVKLDTTLGISADKLNNGTYTSADFYNAVNTGIQNAFYGSGVTFSANSNGQTIVSSSKGEAFSIKGNDKFAELTGLGTISGNVIQDYGYSNSISAGASIDAESLGITSDTPGIFEITINGVTKKLEITPDKDSNGDDVKITNDNLVAKLNAAIEKEFGAEAAKLVKFEGEYEKEPVYETDDEGKTVEDENGDPVVSGERTSSVKLSLIVAENGNKVVETSVSISAAAASSLGFSSGSAVKNDSGSANAVTFAQINMTAEDGERGADIGSGELTVNGATVSYDADTSLSDFLAELNDALVGKGVAAIKGGKLYIDSTSDKITITDSGKLLTNIFGVTSVNASTGLTEFKTQDESYTDTTYKAGKNAEVVINGETIAWSTNTINYNGVNITLNDVSDEEIKINVQSDPEDVISRIKDWMDDYNALVFTLNSTINEGKNSDYSPLTDEQKAEMTEDQIKTWEAEAKKGILRNDQTLRGILADMRNALYSRVEAAGLSLYDIGIVTKSGLSDPNQAGQLEFDSNITGGGEERLRNMLINNPDKVRTLFTDPDNGLGAKLNDVITRASNTSSVNRGTLVRIAGTEQLTGDNTSQLGNKISDIDKYIATLKSRLESEYNRYWKKFSALETSVQKMNMQSSWLSSQ